MNQIRIVFRVLFIAACLPGTAQINYNTYFTDQALRIDYVRTGNAASNTITPQNFIAEPFWSGSRSKTIEPYEYGTYKIEVTDDKSSLLLMSYTCSSLFDEYSYTETGLTEVKSFRETVRIPFPKQTVLIHFSERNKETGRWEKQQSFSFDPNKDDYSDHSDEYGTISKTIHDSGDHKENIDIVFISEGYTQLQKEKFFSDAQRVSGYLLKCRPFSFHDDKINIRAVFAASEEEEITDPSANIERNTILKSNFSTLGTDRYLMTEEHFVLRDIAAVVPYDHIIVLANSKKYGGGGIFNFYATCPSDDPNANFLVVHEFGHSFAGLADEYWTSDVSVTEYYNLSLEPPEPNITTLVSFETKWKDMIAIDIPIPTPAEAKFRNSVGVFEGAGYSATGIYRPFFDCTMKSVRYNAFCPVCTRAIEETIRFFSE